MALKVSVLRPDDLLDLAVECRNLQLDLGGGEGPFLVPEDPAQPSYLIVVFPPQTIAEEATFEPSTLPAPPGEAGNPANQAPPPFPDSQMPGHARARVGGPTRLVFQFPANSNPRIPYTIEGLLNWSGLELSVSPLAAVPEKPSPEQRQAAPGIAAPQPVETAIELPYRLVLSPNGSAAWVHAVAPVTHAGRTELWHTRLALRGGGDATVTEISKAHPAPLRAIWSPDYQPAQSDSPQGWPGLGVPDSWAGHAVLTAMNHRDRHELVILTSAFKGFIKSKLDHSTYEPQPVYAEQLMLSSLGGWLKSRGNWTPPVEWLHAHPIFHAGLQDAGAAPGQAAPAEDAGGAPAGAAAPAQHLADLLAPLNPALQGGAFPLPPIHFPPIELGGPGQALNISEWAHVASQGRDHYVRIVYEGFLYPFGHRASLVKVTERKFREVNGAPFAYLSQRMFIVVRQPLMDYGAVGLPNNGLGMPSKQVRMTTLVTPDIDYPAPVVGFSFWVRVGNQDFVFHAVGQDGAGGRHDLSGPLLFVPNSDAGDPNKINSVRTAYNADSARKAFQVPGEAVTYAERSPAGPDNTTLITQALLFDTDNAGGNNPIPFLPKLDKASVHLDAVEQILGSPAPVDIRYWPNYVTGGFDGGNEVFAQLVSKLPSKFSADKGGGIATPDLSVTGVTRKLGAVAGDLGKAAANSFDPADFFKDVADTATLFGKLKLAELILPGDYSKAPTVQFFPQAAPPSVKLTWLPDFKLNLPAGFLEFHKGPASTLNIEGVIEQPTNGAAAHSLFRGTLTDFSLEFLQVVRLSFDSFRFTAETGKKTDVNVQLKPGDEALEFLGDLKFVNELKNIIPPALFGDGPSLELVPPPDPAIRAGFSIGLPPVAIGIFALKDVSLAAFLTLPFLNGSPRFDFNVSERPRPFALTVAFFGGGGFFHLQVDTLAVRIVEASFEFGAAAAINLGVASGGVHIMAGIYFKLETKADGSKHATLSGYFRMGGELSVLGLISISLEFVLSFTYESGGTDAAGHELPGKATGRATLTVKVEVLFFSTSVDITVEKKFGGNNGDPKFAEVWDSYGIWNEYAGAFA